MNNVIHKHVVTDGCKLWLPKDHEVFSVQWQPRPSFSAAFLGHSSVAPGDVVIWEQHHVIHDRDPAYDGPEYAPYGTAGDPAHAADAPRGTRPVTYARCEYVVYLVATGEPFYLDFPRYLGTVQCAEGLVWHVFMVDAGVAASVKDHIWTHSGTGGMPPAKRP